jgi:hypothetical protein
MMLIDLFGKPTYGTTKQFGLFHDSVVLSVKALKLRYTIFVVFSDSKRRQETQHAIIDVFFGYSRPVFKMPFSSTKILVIKKGFLKTGRELTHKNEKTT